LFHQGGVEGKKKKKHCQVVVKPPKGRQCAGKERGRAARRVKKGLNATVDGGKCGRKDKLIEGFELMGRGAKKKKKRSCAHEDGGHSMRRYDKGG